MSLFSCIMYKGWIGIGDHSKTSDVIIVTALAQKFRFGSLDSYFRLRTWDFFKLELGWCGVKFFTTLMAI